MVWFLHGTEARIVTEGGRHHVWGTARQNVRLATDTSGAALARIHGLDATWSISRADTPDAEIDPNAEGLLKRVKNKPQRLRFSSRSERSRSASSMAAISSARRASMRFLDS